MKNASSFAIAAALLLVGAGCAPQTPSANAPATNTSTNVSANSDGDVAPAPRPGDNTDPNNQPAPAGSGVKNYNSAPYDFQYPEAYILTNFQMTDEFRKPYLDAGLDAPLQQVTMATTVRPPGFEGEGPATVRVIQWNNSQRLPLREWAKKHTSYTGYVGGKGMTESKFQGYTSVEYEYEGLYGGKARLIDLNGTVLHVSADFDAKMGDTNMDAYAKILATMKIATPK